MSGSFNVSQVDVYIAAVDEIGKTIGYNIRKWLIEEVKEDTVTVRYHNPRLGGR